MCLPPAEIKQRRNEMEFDIDKMELEIAAIKNARVAAEIKQRRNEMATLEELINFMEAGELLEDIQNIGRSATDEVDYINAKDRLEQLGQCSDLMTIVLKDLDIGCTWTYPSNNITILDFISKIGDGIILDFFSKIGDASALILLAPLCMLILFLFLYVRRK